MYKNHQLIMLPTNEKANSNIWLNNKTGKLWFDNHGKVSYEFEQQHLYILSDEEIKEGDWYFTFQNGFVIGEPRKCEGSSYNFTNCKKIIATTDKSLGYEDSIYDPRSKTGGKWVELPQIRESFIQYFVEKYNKSNIITEVMVEYNDLITEVPKPYKPYSEVEHLDGTLKVNPKDNTINIKPIKDSWNREELEKLFNSYGDNLQAKIIWNDIQNL